MAKGEEPQSLDKEFLRLYLKKNGFNETNINQIPTSVFDELSKKYIQLYERVTGEKFIYPPESENIQDRITENLKKYFS